MNVMEYSERFSFFCCVYRHDSGVISGFCFLSAFHLHHECDGIIITFSQDTTMYLVAFCCGILKLPSCMWWYNVYPSSINHHVCGGIVMVNFAVDKASIKNTVMYVMEYAGRVRRLFRL